MWNPRNRNSHRFLTGFVMIVFLVGISALFWHEYPKNDNLAKTSASQQVVAGVQVNLSLKKAYVCGVEEEQKVSKTVSSTAEIFRDYHDWELVSHDGNSFVFKKEIQDLPQICKDKGYFGLSDQGVLTLFEGPPAEHKVIQTFFRINTKKLESSMPGSELDFLHKGIRIKDIAEYHSILSTYAEFATDVANTPAHSGNDDEE